MRGRGKAEFAAFLVGEHGAHHEYHDEVLQFMEEQILCEKYGWTLDYIRSMDDVDRMAHTTHLRAENMGVYTENK